MAHASWFRRLPIPRTGQPIVHTGYHVDGRYHSIAFLTNHGHWGFVSDEYHPDLCSEPPPVVQRCKIISELKAARLGLMHLVGNPRAQLIMHGEGAASILKRWQDGDSEPPPWLPKANHHNILRLIQLVQELGHLTIRHTSGKSPSLLQQAAVGVAQIAHTVHTGTNKTVVRQRIDDLVRPVFNLQLT